MTWECHVGEFSASIYDMILGRDILTALGLNHKNYKHGIGRFDGPFELCTAPMVNLGMYKFEILNTEKITLK